jgi:hypothetical protein
MGRFVLWMYHHLGHNDIWDVLSHDVLTFRSGTSQRVMFPAMGPYLLQC